MSFTKCPGKIFTETPRDWWHFPDVAPQTHCICNWCVENGCTNTKKMIKTCVTGNTFCCDCPDDHARYDTVPKCDACMSAPERACIFCGGIHSDGDVDTTIIDCEGCSAKVTLYDTMNHKYCVACALEKGVCKCGAPATLQMPHRDDRHIIYQTGESYD